MCSNYLLNETVEIQDALLCFNSNYTETLSAEEVLGPQYHRTARICILLIMIFLSLIGNSLVCWQLLPLRRRRFPKAKILFLNLAAADLFVTLVAMTSQTVWEIMGKIWLAGDALCRIFKFLQTYSLSLSTFMLVSIALDRYNAIVRPFSRNVAPKTFAIAAWIASLLPSLPCFYVFHLVTMVPEGPYCTSIFYTSQYPPYRRQLYMTCVFLSIFIVPFILLVALYTRILIEIWKQSSAFSSGEQSASSLPRAKIKTLKMTLVIFATFIVTNLPYMIQEMIFAFGNANLLDKNTAALFGVISASNSAFNPYIYLTFQAKETCFGKILRHLLRLLRCQSVASSSRLKKRSSFITVSSKTSSRLDTNAQTMCVQTRAGKLPPTNGVSSKVLDETFV